MHEEKEVATKPQSTTEPKEPRLLPCPLLGHLPDKSEFTAGPYIAVSGAPDMPKFYAVVCPGCCSTAYDEDKERVIKKWNARVSASVAPTVDAAWKVAVEIANDRLGPRSDSPQFWDKYAAYVKGVVEYHFAAASPVAPVEQSDDALSQLLAAGRRWRDARTAYMTDNAVTCGEYGLAGDALAELITTIDAVPAPSAATQDEAIACQRCGKLGGKVVSFSYDSITTSRWVCPHCLDTTTTPTTEEGAG